MDDFVARPLSKHPLDDSDSKLMDESILDSASKPKRDTRKSARSTSRSRSTRKSPKTETKLAELFSEDNAAKIKHISIEYLLDMIRWDFLKAHQSSANKPETFMRIIGTDIKSESVYTEIIRSLRENNYKEFMGHISESASISKKWQDVIEKYYEFKDREESLNFLRNAMFIPFESQEAFDRYIRTARPERSYPSIIWTAKKIDRTTDVLK